MLSLFLPFPWLLQDSTLLLEASPGVSLQRLFSTFANGFPGIGLMLQRLVVSAALLCSAVAHLHPTLQVGLIGPQIIDASAGILLLVGLWTPAVGTVVAVRELWILLSGDNSPWLPLVLATLGATLAMIGPGAWSIDALLFGRKQISRPSR